MATPGWYPDPAGQPGAFRYWDGQGWGAELTDNPYAAPPGGAPSPPAPPPYTPPHPPANPPANPLAPPTVVPGAQPPPAAQGWAGAPQPGWPVQPPPYVGGQPGPGTSGGGSTGKVVGLVALALVLLVALGVGTFFVIRSVADDDGGTASEDPTSQSSDPTDEPTDDSTEEPTEEPTDEPTEEPTDEPVDPFTDPAVPTEQQCAGGTPDQGATGLVGNQFTGGGLTMRRVTGFTAEIDQASAFTFADGVFAPSKEIERTETSGWVAVYALGGLNKSNGFTSPGQAAGVVLECLTRSQLFYQGFTGATLLDSRAATVDGADAWVMDAEVRIDLPELTTQGDIVKVIVVETGDAGRYGLFVSVVPIGDQALISEQQAQEQLLSVD